MTESEGGNTGEGQTLKGLECWAKEFKFYLIKRIGGH